VRAGDPLTAGPLDPQEILEKHGIHVAQDYILREIQRVYRHTHGIDINDKHIEVILRQMFRHRKVGDEKGDTGDTRLLPGEIVDRFVLEAENRRAEELGGRPAVAKPVLMGITQASLAADGFLSAASFQRTTRVLTEAACENRVDHLRGLKENVIIGRLIPAGSGMDLHRDVEVGYAPEVAARVAAAPPPRLEERDMLSQLMERIEAAPEWDLTAESPGEAEHDEGEFEELEGGFEELQDEDEGPDDEPGADAQDDGA